LVEAGLHGEEAGRQDQRVIVPRMVCHAPAAPPL
jgi:hypothetical protein